MRVEANVEIIVPVEFDCGCTESLSSGLEAELVTCVHGEWVVSTGEPATMKGPFSDIREWTTTVNVLIEEVPSILRKVEQ